MVQTHENTRIIDLAALDHVAVDDDVEIIAQGIVEVLVVAVKRHPRYFGPPYDVKDLDLGKLLFFQFIQDRIADRHAGRECPAVKILLYFHNVTK